MTCSGTQKSMKANAGTHWSITGIEHRCAENVKVNQIFEVFFNDFAHFVGSCACVCITLPLSQWYQQDNKAVKNVRAALVLCQIWTCFKKPSNPPKRIHVLGSDTETHLYEGGCFKTKTAWKSTWGKTEWCTCGVGLCAQPCHSWALVEKLEIFYVYCMSKKKLAAQREPDDRKSIVLLATGRVSSDRSSSLFVCFTGSWLAA